MNELTLGSLAIASLLIVVPACKDDEFRKQKEFIATASEQLGCPVEGNISFTRLNVRCENAERGSKGMEYFTSRCGELKAMKVEAVSIEAAKELWYATMLDKSADFANCRFVKQRR